jgi:hypothetical protein
MATLNVGAMTVRLGLVLRHMGLRRDPTHGLPNLQGICNAPLIFDAAKYFEPHSAAHDQVSSEFVAPKDVDIERAYSDLAEHQLVMHLRR